MSMILHGLSDFYGNIARYRLGKVKEGDEGVVVEVRIGGEELSCPYCGKTKLYRHGRCQP
jgi:hypothetical protein